MNFCNSFQQHPPGKAHPRPCSSWRIISPGSLKYDTVLKEELAPFGICNQLSGSFRNCTISRVLPHGPQAGKQLDHLQANLLQNRIWRGTNRGSSAAAGKPMHHTLTIERISSHFVICFCRQIMDVGQHTLLYYSR